MTYFTAHMSAVARAWFRAVSVCADARTLEPPQEDDLFKVDVWTIRYDEQDGQQQVDVQIKATASPAYDAKGEHLRLQLPTRDYLVLSRTPRMVPVILVCVILPSQDPLDWVVEQPDSLLLHCTAYWQSLAGASPPTGATKTVRIPTGQRFDVATLDAMLRDSPGGSQ